MATPINLEIQATDYFPTMIPEEVTIKILSFLDLQSLGRIPVCRLLERLQKEDGLWVINFGSTLWDKCTLDLREKTITILFSWPGMRHCLPAMSYPAVPKGSFVVFVEWNAPCTVIKDNNGSVEGVYDVFIDDENAKSIVTEFRKHVGKPTRYDRFVIIAPTPKAMKEGYIDGHQLIVLDFLEQNKAVNRYPTNINRRTSVNSQLQKYRKE